MRVYCPNCGTDNEAQPGASVSCRACTATFTAPNEQGTVPAPPPTRATPFPGSPDLGETAPPSSSGWVGGVGSPSRSAPLAGPPTPGFARPVPVNPLAIVSLVFGIICCVPFVSPITALVSGWLAIKQIDASTGAQRGRELAIAGLILGVAGLGFWALWLLGLVSKS